MTLEELASDWLIPQSEETFSLPAITNFHGVVQASWGVSGIRNWICPPTGLPTPTALLFYMEGDRIRRWPLAASYRWTAYQIERSGGGVTSVVRMPEGRPAVMERLRFDRAGKFFLVFGGLPRVWRFTDYWNLPPEDVPQWNVRRSPRGFLLEDTKTFGRAEFIVPGRCTVHHDLLGWLEGGSPVERGTLGVAECEMAAGEELLWAGVQGCEEAAFDLELESAWTSGAKHWERVWEAAFTPGNREFSGALPVYEGPLSRLYHMAVLTLLQMRRVVSPPAPRALIATGGQCVWTDPGAQPLEQAYACVGPEGGATTSFLWDLTFQAPLLARLDPRVFRAQLDAMLRVDLTRHWGVELVSGRGAGMGYGVNPGAFLSCAADYVRITGDREWALNRRDSLRQCVRPILTDYGECQNLLECVSTYEHTVASFNALQVPGMRFLAELLEDPALRGQADALAREVLALYAGGPFACLQPDGSRRVVRTILDFVYVGRSLASDLPPELKRGMLAFFEQELQTRDWCYALSPRDPDALTTALPRFQTYRADHQATGAYDAWPALAASVLLRFGEKEKARAWLLRIQELTREGPFGQAHFIHPDGRARKASFFNGNCYLGSGGCAFAVTLLEDHA